VISEVEWLRQRAATVEVIMPDPHVQPEHEVEVEIVGSTDPAPSASLVAADSASLAEKAISALPADLAAQAIDPKRKARSQDPGWKFGWWPDPIKKDFVQCIFCMKVIPLGIKRFKQHIASGFGDTIKCSRVLEFVSNEMYANLKKYTRTVINLDVEESEERNEDAPPQPSSGTKSKQAKKKN
jgi:hypothetical protein